MSSVRRLGPGDEVSAGALFAQMADVFEAAAQPHGAEGLAALMRREDLWVLAAFDDAGLLAGGLTAHVLPMTQTPGRMLFLYDIAVHPAQQRQGHGRRLVGLLRALAAQAGIAEVFVAADNEDTHALDFYQALGGRGMRATFFDL